MGKPPHKPRKNEITRERTEKLNGKITMDGSISEKTIPATEQLC